MVRLAAPGRRYAAPADAGQPPWMRPRRVEEFRASKVTERNDTMSFQAKITHRILPSVSHAFSTAVVRELPSLPKVALGSEQTW
jgi:hypothetical protein